MLARETIRISSAVVLSILSLAIFSSNSYAISVKTAPKGAIDEPVVGTCTGENCSMPGGGGAGGIPATPIMEYSCYPSFFIDIDNPNAGLKGSVALQDCGTSYCNTENPAIGELAGTQLGIAAVVAKDGQELNKNKICALALSAYAINDTSTQVTSILEGGDCELTIPDNYLVGLTLFNVYNLNQGLKCVVQFK